MVFNRDQNKGRIFVSLWIDLNNKENGDATMELDPIREVRTVAVADGNAGQFLDKPWLAVDIPRAGAGICTLQVPQPGGGTVSQSFPGGNVYLTYSTFVGNDVNIRTKLYFTRSTDCGATWSNAIKLSEGYRLRADTDVGQSAVRSLVQSARCAARNAWKAGSARRPSRNGSFSKSG